MSKCFMRHLSYIICWWQRSFASVLWIQIQLGHMLDVCWKTQLFFDLDRGVESVSLSCSSFCSCLCTCNGVMVVGSWILCLFLEDSYEALRLTVIFFVCVCVWICPGCRLFDIQTVGSARLKASDSQLSPLQGIGMQNCITFDRDGLLLATGGKVPKNLLLTIVWNLSTDCVDVVG